MGSLDAHRVLHDYHWRLSEFFRHDLSRLGFVFRGWSHRNVPIVSKFPLTRRIHMYRVRAWLVYARESYERAVPV